MMDITPAHRQELMDDEDKPLDPHNWYHGNFNPKFGGYTTALKAEYGRIIAFPNKRFESYYMQDIQWHKINNTWIQRNYSAVCDPFNKHGEWDVDS